MKKYIPYLIIAALAVAFLFSVRGCFRRTIQERQIIQAATQGPDTGRVFRDSYNREHRRAQAAEGTSREMQLAYGRLMDSVARLNKIKARQIEQITWLSTELRASRLVAVMNAAGDDGRTAVSFDYTDPWIHLQGDGFIRNDSLSDIALSYSLRDSLILTRIRKRTWLLGRRYTLIDITSANPDMRISGSRSVVIRDRPKPFGLGLQLGATYSGAGWRPYAGLGLSYNLVRF